MFRCDAGKDFVVIARDDRCKDLSSDSKQICGDCRLLYRHLLYGRRILWSDVRQSRQMWQDLLQKFNLLMAQVVPNDPCNIPFRPCTAGSIHWLRHAHASRAIDNGAPIALVSATLGHADLKTTSVYAHARPGESSGRYLKTKF